MNIEQERTYFEAWYRLHHGSRDVYGRDASGEYADKQVQGAFNVWQARAAMTAQDEALLRQALEALEVSTRFVYADLRPQCESTIDALRERLAETADALARCPNCGGPADNGHDREVPPTPYWRSKCTES